MGEATRGVGRSERNQPVSPLVDDDECDHRSARPALMAAFSGKSGRQFLELARSVGRLQQHSQFLFPFWNRLLDGYFFLLALSLDGSVPLFAKSARGAQDPSRFLG